MPAVARWAMAGSSRGYATGEAGLIGRLMGGGSKAGSHADAKTGAGTGGGFLSHAPAGGGRFRRPEAARQVPGKRWARWHSCSGMPHGSRNIVSREPSARLSS